MKRFRVAFALIVTVALLSGSAVWAQQAGSLRGTARLDDGSAVPGVLVTASSAAMLGQRTTSTSETGQWILRNLPPGDYTVTFELEGMATVQSSAVVSLGQDTPLSVPDVTGRGTDQAADRQQRGPSAPPALSSGPAEVVPDRHRQEIIMRAAMQQRRPRQPAARDSQARDLRRMLAALVEGRSCVDVHRCCDGNPA